MGMILISSVFSLGFVWAVNKIVRKPRWGMFGSLRAAKSCLECHSVQRGDLLGAFTYELVPSRPIRKKPQQEPAVN